MSTTAIGTNSGLAPKQWSEALFAMVGKQPTPVNSLAGPAPDITKATKVLRRQSTTDMPIVRVNDLASSAGDTVRVDCANVIKLRPVMGDENAEGKGAKLDFTYKDVKIDMATIPVSAGGKMTQKRFQHDLRLTALAQLKGGIPNFLWQRILVQLAGARGQQDGVDWILPLDTDPDFTSMMVNTVKCPTYNRHYVVDGNDLIQGGAQLASIDTSDSMKLVHIDVLSALISELTLRLMPIRIPGDPAAGDDPIKGVLLLDHLVWNAIITDTTAGNNIRTWQTNAMERASYGNLRAHPLFSGSPWLWNGILVRKMGDFGIRWAGGSGVQYVTSGNRYTGSAGGQQTESTATLPSLSGYQVNRSLLLGAQALAMCAGINTQSEVPYSMLENSTNFGRNLEMAGEIMGAEDKLRFSLPDGKGNYEPTDIGVIAIDSVTKQVSA